MADLNLKQWLDKITHQHPAEIEFGLERIEVVAKAIGADFYRWLKQPEEQVVLIGGTNGKGTTVAIVESLCINDNKTVFSYTSPHLLRFNERFRLNGKQESDQSLIDTFQQIELARDTTKLTFFEFTTLAAFLIAFSNNFEVLLFEIGLGGRLDAVNLIEPDISVITSIAVDHTDWLGHRLFDIAKEKLAIARKDKILILADNMLSAEIINMANNSGADCLLLGKDFTVEEKDTVVEIKIQAKNSSTESYHFETGAGIHPHNMAGALVIASQLKLKLKGVNLGHIINKVKLPARFETVYQNPHIIVDVSHNEQAIATLAKRIKALKGPVYLVCGMLKDKAIKQSLKVLSGLSYQWYLSDLSVERGATAKHIQQQLNQNEKILCFDKVETAIKSAIVDANMQGSIIIFGSFITAEAAIRCYKALVP